jgi:hypothetical protein
MKDNKAFSEVIESSLARWLTQSWQWDHFPAFGSLLTVESNGRTIFGIVCATQTGSMDPVRYPFPYKKTPEQLMKEQPQIFEFLKTTFSCLTVGYQEQGKIFYMLAPEPPKIHSFVSPAPNELQKQFFASEKYLPLLFSSNETIATDELLLAILKQYALLNILSVEKMNNFVNMVSLITGNEYRKLKLFLQRAAHIIS